MSDENIMFDVKRWPALMYQMEKKANPGIRQAENKGADKSTRWSKVMQEGFSCLLDPQTKKLEDPPSPGFEVEQAALENMTAMSEFKALQEYTRGDEYAAGNAIACLSKAVANKLVKKKSHRDVDKLQDELDTLQDLDEQGVPVEEDLKKAQKELKKALKEQADLAKGIDPVGVRIAVRTAAREAAEEIENERSAISALSWGDEPGTPVNKGVTFREDAAKLRQSGKLQQIAKEAGRQRALACKKQSEKAESARVEVDSIETGDELSRLLGSELMLLMGDEVEELMFYQRYSDKQCLQLKLSGKEEKQQGPIIFVVDTSGSQNPYEIMTKATVLAMLDVAKLQNRSFGIVWFSSGVNRVDYLRKGEAVETAKVMDLLQYWTSGGTNFQSALDRAVTLIQEDGDFQQADIIMITDGACNTSTQWDQRFQQGKKDLSFTVYSVLTSTSYMSTVKKWSDQVWSIQDLMRGRVQDTIYSI